MSLSELNDGTFFQAPKGNGEGGGSTITGKGAAVKPVAELRKGPNSWFAEDGRSLSISEKQGDKPVRKGPDDGDKLG